MKSIVAVVIDSGAVGAVILLLPITGSSKLDTRGICGGCRLLLFGIRGITGSEAGCILEGVTTLTFASPLPMLPLRGLCGVINPECNAGSSYLFRKKIMV